MSEQLRTMPVRPERIRRMKRKKKKKIGSDLVAVDRWEGEL